MPSRKGSPNKNKAFLLSRLQDMYGDDFHPILKMAENAVTMQGLIDKMNEDDYVAQSIALDKANTAWDKVASYTEPKLKAVEVTGKDGEALVPSSIKVNYTE